MLEAAKKEVETARKDAEKAKKSSSSVVLDTLISPLGMIVSKATGREEKRYAEFASKAELRIRQPISANFCYN